MSLIKNYLHNRSQVVMFGPICSDAVSLVCGVPQGSILSPLLFNLYVNDICDHVKASTVFLYADDTLLVSSNPEFSCALANLQEDAIKVSDWFASNLIQINSTKSRLVCFRNPHKDVPSVASIYLHPSYCSLCSCQPIASVQSVKYLGVHIDSDLTWNTHLTHICKKLRSVACLLFNLKTMMPFSIRKLIAQALGYSVLRYGMCCFLTALSHGNVELIGF